MATATPQRLEQKIADDMAFVLQQTAVCLGSDALTDPWISALTQNYLSKKFPPKPGKDYNAFKGAWASEFAGDGAAVLSFLAIQRLCPNLTPWIKQKAEALLGGRFQQKARTDADHWARRHGVENSGAHYEQKLAEFKNFQLENFAKSSLIAANSTVLNVVASKLLFKNPNHVLVITAGKMIGALTTMGIMLTGRWAFPRQARQLDQKLAGFAEPVIRSTHSLLGITPEYSSRESETDTTAQKDTNFTHRIDAARRLTRHTPQKR